MAGLMDMRRRKRLAKEVKGDIPSLGEVLFTGKNNSPWENWLNASRDAAPATNNLIHGNTKSLLERAQEYHGGSFAEDQQKNLSDELRRQKEQRLVGIGRGITQQRVGSPNITHSPDASGMYPEIYSAEMPDKGDNVVSRQSALMSNFSNAVPKDTNPYVPLEGGEMTPGELYTGNPMDDSPETKTANEAITTQKTSTKIARETPENTPSLWKTWGSLADNPKERKKAYLSSIKNIYMKKMMLDSIAKLTGGTSQGGSWAQMAIAELDAVEKFDSEERVHQQWKALFFREDGTYDPPKNRKEAMERGGKLGYTADQMKDILTTFSKEEDNRTNIEKYEEYISSLPEGSPKRIALEKKYLGMHEEEKDDRTSDEKFIERMVDSGLLSKEDGDEALVLKAKGKKDSGTAAIQNFNWYNSIKARGNADEIALADRFLGIVGQKAAGIQEYLRLYTSQTFQDSDSFSASEKLQLENLIKRGMGLGVSTGTPDVSDRDRAQQLKAEGTTREGYAQIVRKKHPQASNTDIEDTVQALYD